MPITSLFSSLGECVTGYSLLYKLIAAKKIIYKIDLTSKFQSPQNVEIFEGF